MVTKVDVTNEVRASDLSGMANQGIVFTAGEFLLGATDMVTNHPNPFTIGQVGGWGDFVGYIDEVAVYDKALDEARVKAHYDAAQGN